MRMINFIYLLRFFEFVEVLTDATESVQRASGVTGFALTLASMEDGNAA